MTPQNRHPLQNFESRGISADLIDIAQARPVLVQEACELVINTPGEE